MFDFNSIQIIKPLKVAVMTDTENKNIVTYWKFQNDAWVSAGIYNFSNVDLDNAILPITVTDEKNQRESTWDYRHGKWVMLTDKVKSVSCNYNEKYFISYELDIVDD